MIDDTKDSDSTNTHGKDKSEQEKVQKFLNSCLELRSYLKHGSARNIANMIKGKI